MSELHITVIGLPAPQGSKRGFYNPKVGHVQMVESSTKVKPWRQDVRAAAVAKIEETGWQQLTGPVHVSITFYLPRPRYHYRSGQHAHELRPTAPVFVDKKPDLDKLIRSSCDALTQAGVYRDDSQIAEFVVTKKYAAGRWAEMATPGAVIDVAPMDPIPQTAAPAVTSTPIAGAAPPPDREEVLFP